MNPDQCECCWLTYDDFRTNLTFAEVQAMLWVDSDDPKDWKHKRRNTVLGFWRETKLKMWSEHLYLCAESERMKIK